MVRGDPLKREVARGTRSWVDRVDALAESHWTGTGEVRCLECRSP